MLGIGFAADRIEALSAENEQLLQQMTGEAIIESRLHDINTELLAENGRLRETLEMCLGELYAPDQNCSCHISAPCNDCADYGFIREAMDAARAALKGAEQ